MLKSIKARVAFGVGAVVSFISSIASAALSVEQQAVVDGVDTLVTDMSGVAWSLVLALTTLFIGMKLFKKVIGKAT